MQKSMDNWEKNREALEVLNRLKRIKEIRLQKTLLGRIFGRAATIKPSELERVFNKSGIEMYQREYPIEDSKNYENSEWKSNGKREGYDNGIIVFSRPKPRSFSFSWIPYFTQAHVLSGPYEKFEYREERDPNQPIVETIDEKEALKLIDNGYSLIDKKTVPIRHVHFPDDVGPMDWPDPIDVDTLLFILAHPNTSKSTIDKHTIEWKPRHCVVEE